MPTIEEILTSKLKPKEKVTKLVEAVKQKKVSAQDFFAFFKAGSDVEKGTCADVMKHVSKDKPEVFVPYIDDMIEYINYDAPRVKWGIPESIGNISQKYPEKVEKAIPKLLINTKEESTVIRWCAAYGLTEIAKNNPKKRTELLPIFAEMIAKEQNNGVKNVYSKALKVIEKEDK
jgi:hypothetical protein